MEKQVITPDQEKRILNNFFTEIRELLAEYCEEREMVMTNSQLFAFLLVSPVSIAIATDGTVDFSETTMLVDVAAYFDRGVLPSEFDTLAQPDNVMTDHVFKKRIYTELRYLCVSMNRYEDNLIDGLKALIKLDEKLSQTGEVDSIKRKIAETLNNVIYNNLGKDSVEEPKIRQILEKLEIADITVDNVPNKNTSEETEATTNDHTQEGSKEDLEDDTTDEEEKN
ncbi:hypothetical protein BKI52_10320 [marine bacterium AO1-C]|nr:hypothetical protein BKI52_10320 [marine bacterium AO1-C]